MESAAPALKILGVDPEKDIVITRDQVQYAKPNPDLFLTAAERLGVEISASVVVGDSVWDLLAAWRARALGVGLLSGGYGKEELEKAGAYRVYKDPAEMLEHLDEIGVGRHSFAPDIPEHRPDHAAEEPVCSKRFFRGGSGSRWKVSPARRERAVRGVDGVRERRSQAVAGNN